jgi:hypothetical protein
MTEKTQQEKTTEEFTQEIQEYIKSSIQLAVSCSRTAVAFERVLELENENAPQSILMTAKDVAQEALLDVVEKSLLFAKDFVPQVLTALAEAESPEEFLKQHSIKDDVEEGIEDNTDKEEKN